MKILILGDVSPTEALKPLFAAGETETLFGNVKELFDAADFSFVNLECAISDAEQGIQKFGPCLKAPLGTEKVLKELGVSCCGLSNNHIFDFGRAGALQTIEALESQSILYTGFGKNLEEARKNLIVEKNGERIAIIAVCEHEYSYALEDRMGSRPYDPYDTMADIRKAKETCDRVIVIYHGGKELFRYPSPRVLRLFRAMAENGADVVVGQHSHCIATYENFQGAHLLHGQGNFHFVSKREFEGWNECVAMIYDTVSGEVEWVPVVGKENGVMKAEGEEKETILRDFAARSATLQDGTWKEGWHAHCVGEKERYFKAIACACNEDSTDRQQQKFAHYLDCEAHTDVWRELFPTYNQYNEK